MITLDMLFHRRWAVPILAELHRSAGARFVVLANRIGANQGAVREALDELIRLGLVMRNPGHGHPLRPEYVLTRAGESAAPPSRALMAALREHALEDVCLRKWSLPVLHVLAERPARFSTLKDRLAGISDRALAVALKELEAGGLIARRVVDGYPPTAVYAPTPLAAPLQLALGGLACALGG